MGKASKGPESAETMVLMVVPTKPSGAPTMRLIKEATSSHRSSTQILLHAVTATTTLTRQAPIVPKTPAMAPKSQPSTMSVRAREACFMLPSPMRSSA